VLHNEEVTGGSVGMCWKQPDDDYIKAVGVAQTAYRFGVQIRKKEKMHQVSFVRM